MEALKQEKRPVYIPMLDHSTKKDLASIRKGEYALSFDMGDEQIDISPTKVKRQRCTAYYFIGGDRANKKYLGNTFDIPYQAKENAKDLISKEHKQDESAPKDEGKTRYSYRPEYSEEAQGDDDSLIAIIYTPTEAIVGEIICDPVQELLYYEANNCNGKAYSTVFEAKQKAIEALMAGKKPDKREIRKKKTPVAYLPTADSDFYPTPSALAGKMLAMVEAPDKIHTILEPSAGKGDLLDAMKSATERYKGKWYTRNSFSSVYDVDCIELDRNLQCVLKGKGYRVVHDDFLTYKTRKHYDLIFANFPFSDGEYHLEKALLMQENGGEIVCVLNAETLKNPYTMHRATLLKKLNELHADILYVEHAFSRAERRSDVEIAIVHVNIPKPQPAVSSIYESMRKAAAQSADADAPKAVACETNRIDALIAEYELEVSSTLELIKQYNAMVPFMMHGSKEYSSSLIKLHIGRHECEKEASEGAINDYLRIVRGKYWDQLFTIPELTKKLTSDVLSNFRNSVKEMQDYEFSVFNVRQVVEKLHGSIVSGVENSIMKLFDTLTDKFHYREDADNENIHYYNGWKSNLAHKINSKVVLPINGFSSYSWKKDELDTYYIVETLDDMEKVLDYLDCGESFHSSVESVIDTANRRGVTKKIQFKYFSVDFFKKGTAHIKFTNMHVLDALNIYAARNRNWLPPFYGKTRYEDMPDEAKQVIDEFQGKEEYAKVINEPERYLFDASAIPALSAGE